jgi:hypothetical protein
VPHHVAQDYVEVSRAHRPGSFDAPHGRVGYGWEGAFGSEGEFSTAADRIAPAEHPLNYSPHLEERGMQQRDPNMRRGPKNYTRPDERIKDEIWEALSRDRRIDPSDIVVEVQDGKVTLYGSVAHRQMKHWIEDIAANMHGVSEVENKLTVAIAAAPPADRRMSPGGMGR